MTKILDNNTINRGDNVNLDNSMRKNDGMNEILIDRVVTKQGDDGCTLSFFGARERKFSAKVKLLGELDELNACIGVAMCRCKVGMGYGRVMEEVQQKLFDIGAQLYSGHNRIDNSDVDVLEKKIKDINALLEPLVSFIVPRGESAVWHVARAVCRRTERALWEVGIGLDMWRKRLNERSGVSDYCCMDNDSLSNVNLDLWMDMDIDTKNIINDAVSFLMRGHECSECEGKEKVNGYVCEKWVRSVGEGYVLIGKYLNRLSDLLFCISRISVGDKNDIKNDELLWKR